MNLRQRRCPSDPIGKTMYLLYCDETNLEQRSGDFFVYAGVSIDGDGARELSLKIDKIRADAKVPVDYRLKFNPGPAGFSNQQFIDLKKAVIAAAVEAKALLLVSVILHDIAQNSEVARRLAINTLCYHFDCILNRKARAGLVLIDRFTDKQIDLHLVEKFSIGVTGLPHTPQLRLSNIVGFHYSAMGQSHFCSLIDVVIGSLRFAINAFTRGDQANIESAKRILEGLQPLFFRENEKASISDLSFSFSPKTVLSARYREQYLALKNFLAENGANTTQMIQGG
jgi:hypothetical protein